MDISEFDLSAMMGDLQQVLYGEMEDEEFEEQPMAEYTFKFTEINTGNYCVFSFDHRVNCPPDVLLQAAMDDLVDDFTAADIEIDRSETMQDGKLAHENCWNVVFRLDDCVFEFDGIPIEENEEDLGESFRSYIMPIVVQQLALGKFELLETIEYED